MRQKFSVTLCDIPMNIVCDETQETIDKAVSALDSQVRGLCAAAGQSCSRTEAALLAALDYYTQCMHLQERVGELDEFVRTADPTGDTYGASLLRGENETLRAELEVSRGSNEALMQDNAVLAQLNAKLARQSNEANARADRMHDQVLAILTEVQELREKLAAVGEGTRDNTAMYQVKEEEPKVEWTEAERQVTQKYEQMDIDDILETAPGTVSARAAAPAAGAQAAGIANAEESHDQI